MEILQTIWNVLTTENERLTNIIVSPLVFIESYLYFIIFTKILHINFSNKQKYLYIILLSVLGTINIFIFPSPYYTFVNILLCPALSFFVLKLNVLKACLTEITIYIISLIIGTPTIIIMTLILKTNSLSIATIPIYKILFLLVFYLLLYLFYMFLPKITKIFQFFHKFKITNNNLFIFNFILGTLSIGIQFYIEFVYINHIPMFLILVSIFILLCYFITSIYSLLRTNKLEVTTQNLEQEKLYNQTLTLLYDNIRGFKHDFNNIVQGIGGYISTNNMEDLKEYYSEVLEDCQRVNNLSLLSPEIINNPAIYSLLTAKYHEALESEIKMNLEIFMDLSTINMKIYELTKILGILIDNAIEAAKQCEEKEITITIRKDNKKNKQLFIIENTYANKDVNINEIFEKGKTSKVNENAKNHGLGLWEVRQIVKKNKNLDLYTTKSEKYFKQQFEIYC